MVAIPADRPTGPRAVAARFADALRARYRDDVVTVRLFGSCARGQAHEGSDVDIAVVLERVDWRTRCDVIDLASDIGLEHDLRLSPTLFDRATFELWRAQERPLVRDIEHDGVAL